MSVIKANFARTPFCCGLMEIGDFGEDYPYTGETLEADSLKSGHAYISVTTAKNKTEIAWLKKKRFTKVGRWRNPGTGRMLTLWAKMPRGKK